MYNRGLGGSFGGERRKVLRKVLGSSRKSILAAASVACRTVFRGIACRAPLGIVFISLFLPLSFRPRSRTDCCGGGDDDDEQRAIRQLRRPGVLARREREIRERDGGRERGQRANPQPRNETGPRLGRRAGESALSYFAAVSR